MWAPAITSSYCQSKIVVSTAISVSIRRTVRCWLSLTSLEGIEARDLLLVFDFVVDRSSFPPRLSCLLAVVETIYLSLIGCPFDEDSRVFRYIPLPLVSVMMFCFNVFGDDKTKTICHLPFEMKQRRLIDLLHLTYPPPGLGQHLSIVRRIGK